MSESFQAGRLEALLREELPMAAFMEVKADAWDDDGLILSVPAPPNLNVHGTMFGGSIGALALLAGWGLLRLTLRRQGLDPEVVVQRVTGEYLRPIHGGARARARTPEPGAWFRFLRTLRRRRRARLLVEVDIRPETGATAAEFEAWFVAVSRD